MPCSLIAAGPGKRAGQGQGPGGARPALAGAVGVLDAPDCDPIIGRRGTGRGAVVVAADPMGSSGAGAPGCGHPSGVARGTRPRGMGLVRAGCGINQMRPPRGAGFYLGHTPRPVPLGRLVRVAHQEPG